MNPDFHSFSSFLRRFHHVPESVLAAYFQLWVPEVHGRRQVLTRPGEIQKQIYFVLEGVQKSYFSKDGNQHVIAFTYAPSFTGIPESFFTQTPSRYFLETITASRLLKINYDSHEAFLQEHRVVETLLRKMTEWVLSGVIERHHELMAYDMETRFRCFVNRSAHLINKVSQKDLASYLRMDSTNLSKLINTIKI